MVVFLIEGLVGPEVRACPAVAGCDQMQDEILHIVAEFSDLGVIRLARVKHVEQRAELVAVVRADFAGPPPLARYRILARLGVPIRRIWVADAPLPDFALLAHVVAVRGQKHRILHLLGQVESIDDVLRVLGYLVGVMLSTNRFQCGLGAVIIR